MRNKNVFFYRVIYDIPTQTNISINNDLLSDINKYIKIEIKRFFLPLKYKYRDDYGDKLDGTRNFMDESVAVDSRVLGHIKHYNRGWYQNYYLEKIIDICRVKNIELNIVIMPVSKKYRELSYDFAGVDLFSELNKYVFSNNNVFKIDLFDDKEFSDEYFGDYDHLNEKGAEKCTDRLNELIFNKYLFKY